MKRENFGSQFGAIMAMTGSAVGLGNLWRFPYMVGVYGGAAFVLVYIIMVFLLCLPILNAEMIIGRSSQTNAFRAFRKLAPGTGWKWAGVLMIFTPLVVLSYYSVIGGWSIEYLYKSVCFDFTAVSRTREDLDGIFSGYISSVWAPISGHTVFLGATALIVVLGVRKGIENFGKVMMPLLFVLVILIAVRAATLPGAGEGFAYLFRPDFSKITPEVCAAALGQGFFSLSVGFGIMLTYASYMNKSDSIGKSSLLIATSDLLFALIASCAIMPAVFAFGLSPEAGPSLLFEVLPFIFSQMPAGGVIAILFFIALLVAALTSSVSILEVGVAWLVEEKHMSRKKASLVIFVGTWILGVICSLSFGPLSHIRIFGDIIFDFLDKFSSNVLMTVGALVIVLFVGWKMKREDVRNEFTNGGSLRAENGLFRTMYFIIRYAAPAAILVIMISNLV